MRFDLTDLRLFLNTIEAASITHGAARTNLALASASARIRGMEALLGTPLLERQRRGVRPTPAGRALVHHARIVLQQLERMRGELGAYGKGLKARLRLLSNTAGLTEFLPEALAAYLAAHPNVDIDLEERPSAEIVPAVAEGLADLGIVADAVDMGDLETFPFRSDQLVLIAPRNHPLAKRRTFAFREALDQDFVGLGAGSALQEYLGEHAARAGHPLKLRVRVSSFDAICRMVEQGVGVAVIPEMAARRCRKSMALGAVRLSDAWASRRLTLCLRRFDALSPQAQQLVEHLRVGGTTAARARR
jgi:DNA-binding transcriptional LysR family regulator